MSRFLHFLIAFAVVLGGSWAASAEDSPDSGEAKPLVILLVLDGLRHDYISEELTPVLHELMEQGVRFDKHHAVFPTVTRVNAASMVTGTYPASHGLMDNTVYVPEVDPDRPLSTADYQNLLRIDEATGGQLLTRPTLGEILHEQGHKLVVCSGGSTGSAFLLNHRAETTGALINPDVVLPASLEQDLEKALGPAPPKTYPNTPRNTWAVDAFFEVALPTYDPSVAILWLSDPDHTAHARGIGTPDTLEAIRDIDGLVGTVLERLEALGRRDSTNFIVTADHGFVTFTGDTNPLIALRSMVISLDMNPNDVIFAGNGVHFREPTDEKVDRFVHALQEQPWIGPIFTREMGPGLPFGSSLGTLSMSLIRYAHPRAPQVLYAPDWNDDTNEAGYAGTSNIMGIAGHGGFSPHEVRTTLFVAGPAFKEGTESPAPSDHVDLAPTILHLLGMDKPGTMEGRILREALKGGPNPAGMEYQPQLWRNKFAADFGGEAYQIEVSELHLGNRVYHVHGRAWRGSIDLPPGL